MTPTSTLPLETIVEANQQTIDDIQTLIQNVDRSINQGYLDRSDIDHLKRWRKELVSQLEDLEAKLP